MASGKEHPNAALPEADKSTDLSARSGLILRDAAECAQALHAMLLFFEHFFAREPLGRCFHDTPARGVNLL